MDSEFYPPQFYERMKHEDTIETFRNFVPEVRSGTHPAHGLQPNKYLLSPTPLSTLLTLIPQMHKHIKKRARNIHKAFY